MATAKRASASSREIPWNAVSSVGVGLFGLGLAVGAYGTYVSLLIASGVEPDAAGFGMSLFLLGQLLAVVPADRLTRTMRVERVAALGLAGAGVGIVIGGVVTLEATYLSRFLLGLGQGTAFVAGMKYVGLRTSGSDTATAQGMLGALFTLGLAIGLAASPPVVDAFGVTAPVIAAAVVTFLGSLLTIQLAAVTGNAVTTLRSYVEPFTSASGLALGLGNMATFGFLMVAATWYTEVLADVAVPAVVVLVGFALATVLGRGLGGWLSRDYGERATVSGSLLGLAIVLVGLAVAIAADSPIGISIGLVATGFGFGIPFGPLFSLAFSELTDDSGVTLSGMLLVGNAGALAYPWFVGWLLAATAGYAAGFAAMGLSVGGVWLLWIRSIGH